MACIIVQYSMVQCTMTKIILRSHKPNLSGSVAVFHATWPLISGLGEIAVSTSVLMLDSCNVNGCHEGTLSSVASHRSWQGRQDF